MNEPIADGYFLRVNQTEKKVRLYLGRRGRPLGSVILDEDEVERMIDKLAEAVNNATAPMRRRSHTFHPIAKQPQT